MSKSVTRSKLRSLAAALDSTNFLNYRDFLEELYASMKAAQETYSYLQFSEDLGFPKNNGLHLILRGKRRLTRAASAKILAALDLKHVHRLYFEALVEVNNATDPVVKEKALRKLEAAKLRKLQEDFKHTSSEQLRYFSDWFHPVVREAFQLKDFKLDAEWLSSILEPRVPSQDIEKSFNLLRSLGMIRLHARSWEATKEDIVTDENIVDMGLFLYLKKMTELGNDALIRLRETRRDMSAITISGSSETMDKIKAEIALFQEKILLLSEEDAQKDQIIQVNLQMFPLTKEIRRVPKNKAKMDRQS